MHSSAGCPAKFQKSSHLPRLTEGKLKVIQYPDIVNVPKYKGKPSISVCVCVCQVMISCMYKEQFPNFICSVPGPVSETKSFRF